MRRSTCQFRKKVCCIDDIGAVEDAAIESETEVKLSIAGVRHFEKFYGCYSCSGKVISEPDNSCHVTGVAQFNVLTNANVLPQLDWT